MSVCVHVSSAALSGARVPRRASPSREQGVVVRSSAQARSHTVSSPVITNYSDNVIEKKKSFVSSVCARYVVPIK